MWDRKPNDDELTCERLQRGWQPQASELVSGPAILGNAARLLDGRLQCAGTCIT